MMTNYKITNRPKIEAVSNAPRNINNKSIINVICQQGNDNINNSIHLNLFNGMEEEKGLKYQNLKNSLNSINHSLDLMLSNNIDFNSDLKKFSEEVDNIFFNLIEGLEIYINKIYEYIENEIKKKLKNYSNEVLAHYSKIAKKILDEAYEKAKNNSRISTNSFSSFGSGANCDIAIMKDFGP